MKDNVNISITFNKKRIILNQNNFFKQDNSKFHWCSHSIAFRFFYNAYFNKIQKKLNTNPKLEDEKMNVSEENNLKKLDTETEETSELKKTQWFLHAVKPVILKHDIKVSSFRNTHWKRTIIWMLKLRVLIYGITILWLFLDPFQTCHMSDFDWCHKWTAFKIGF